MVFCALIVKSGGGSAAALRLGRRILLSGLLSGMGGSTIAAPDVAPPATPPSADLNCGTPLSPAVFSVWQSAGGKDGRLGCPTGPEGATATSPRGSTAREARFDNGTIILHQTGPQAGQAYAVAACYRLYFQFGGPGGWLGLPVSEAVNLPDGQRQAFEGGRLTLDRALNACEADHDAASAPAAVASGVQLTPLDVFRDAAGQDYVSAGSQNTTARLAAAGFSRVRTEARVLADETPGAVPLKLYWNEAAGDHRTVATPQGERDALASGYVFDGVQGFVWPTPLAGSVALKQFRNPGTGRQRLIGDDETEARAQGFDFLRIEGYAPGGG